MKAVAVRTQDCLEHSACPLGDVFEIATRLRSAPAVFYRDLASIAQGKPTDVDCPAKRMLGQFRTPLSVTRSASVTGHDPDLLDPTIQHLARRRISDPGQPIGEYLGCIA